LRVSRKAQNKMKNNNNNKFEEFKKIIETYIKSDISKAKFLLEEFSNFEDIKKARVSSPSTIGITKLSIHNLKT